MACIYFRVPHYVASYIRNRDPKNKVAAGDILKRGHIESVAHIIDNGLFLNGNEIVMHNGCFCERQWMRMLHGQCIFGNAMQRRKPMIVPKTDTFLLTDEEVSQLSGIDFCSSKNEGEYLRIQIPEEIILPDGVHKTGKNYQLMNGAANQLRAAFLQEFKRALYDFMGRERDWQQAEGISRLVKESLGRFMTCYDIQNGVNDAELNALKRNWYRWRMDKNVTEADYFEHGD